jgi:hypothetical protein
MKTTLVDFYLNVLLICAWIWVRERSKVAAIGWCLFLVCLGSFATWAYVFWLTLSLRQGDSLAKLLLG